MADEVISSLELQIKTSADKALVALTLLEKKLSSIGDALDEVNKKATGLSNFSKSKISVIFNDVESSAKKAGKAVDDVSKKKVAPKVDVSATKEAIESTKRLGEQLKAVADAPNFDKGSLQADLLRKAATGAADAVRKANISGLMGNNHVGKILSDAVEFKHTSADADQAAKAVGNLAKSMETAAKATTAVNSSARQSSQLSTTMQEAASAAEQYTAKRRELLAKVGNGAKPASLALGSGARDAARQLRDVANATHDISKATDQLTPGAARKFQAIANGAVPAYIGLRKRAEEAAQAERDVAAATEQATDAAKRHISVVSAVAGAFGDVRSVLSTVGNGFKKIGSFLGTIGRYAGSAISGLKKFAGAMVHPIRSMKQLLGMDTQVKRRGGLLGSRSFGQFVGLIALRRAVSAAIRAIVQGVREGVQNVAQYSSQVNNSISSMYSALGYLKNAWGAAFAPIISAVAPYVTALINMLATALNAIGRFLAALTGKGFAVQAAPVWKDYAASLEKTGSAGSSAGKGLGEATKAAEEYKKTIMGFDQLHVLNEPDTSSGSGGSGGGGGGGGSGLNVQDMFETVSTQSELEGLAGKIAEAVKKGDWYQVGAVIAEALNEQLDKLNGKWPEIQKKCKQIAENIGNTINGFVEKFNWGGLGKAIAEGINTVLITANTFLKTVHWQSVGYAIGDFISGALRDLKWDQFGQFAGNMWNSLWTTLSSAVLRIEWGSLGTGIGNAVVNFLNTADFKTPGQFVSRLFDGISTAIQNFLNTTHNLDGLGDKIADFIVEALGNSKSTDWSTGAYRSNSLADNLILLAKSIGTQLYEALTRPDVQQKFREFGDKIGEIIGGLPWESILSGLVDIFASVIGNAITGAYQGWQVQTMIDHGVDPQEAHRIKKENPEFLADPLGQYEVQMGTYNNLVHPATEQNANNAKLTSEGILTLVDSIESWCKKLFNKDEQQGRPTRPTLPGGDVGLGVNVSGTILPIVPKVDTKNSKINREVKTLWNNEVTKKGPQPINAGVKNDSPTWSANVKKWWEGTKTKVSDFGTGVKNDASTWWSNTKQWWSGKVGKAQEFTTNVKDQASAWWDKAKSRWASKARTGKTQEFSTTVKDQSASWWSRLKNLWSVRISGSKAASFSTDVKNESGSWWANLKNFWSTRISGRKAQSFETGPKNQSWTWWSDVKSWWSNRISGSIAPRFSVGPRNQSWTWWSDVKSWWNGSVGTLWATVKMSLPRIKPTWGQIDVLGTTLWYPTGLTTWAKGGILDRAALLGLTANGYHVAGEAGREAILPLDNNTAWMGKFAGKVSDNVSHTMTANIEAAISGAVAAAMMAGDRDNAIPIENHITIKTQNDEILARAVERGQAKRKFRTSVSYA